MMNESCDNIFVRAVDFYQAGRLADAERACRQLLTGQPSHPLATHLLGRIAYDLGHYQVAIEQYDRALSCPQPSPLHCYDLGLAYVAVGRYADAIAAWERTVRLNPRFVEAWNNLGAVCNELGENGRAVVALREAIRLRPAYAEAHHNLGTALQTQGKLPEAKASFETALQNRPAYPEAANGLGMVLHELRDLDGAIRQYRHALALRPSFAEASNNLATALKEKGELPESIARFQATLRLKPEHAIAHYSLSQFVAEGRYQYGPAEFAQLKALADAEGGRPLDRSVLCFAVASLLDKQGDYDTAFAYYRRANELRKQLQLKMPEHFDPAEHRQLADRIVSVFDRAYFEKVRGWQTTTELPIWILGMPRCGSTLVEQILATHPAVAPGEELGVIPSLASRLAGGAGDPHLYRSMLPIPDAGTARSIANDYLSVLARIGPGCERVTVKTLENFLHLGLLATLYSGCRVIHVRRNAMDTCLSCYFQNFHRLEFVWSLEDIAVYYREYEKLMAHWGRVLPLPILDVSYEELVENPEKVTRELFAFCGLDWDAKCLEFFKNRYTVRTASSIQVRKPLSKSAVGRWKRYAAHLAPLREALGDAAPPE